MKKIDRVERAIRRGTDMVDAAFSDMLAEYELQLEDKTPAKRADAVQAYATELEASRAQLLPRLRTQIEAWFVREDIRAALQDPSTTPDDRARLARVLAPMDEAHLELEKRRDPTTH